MGVKAPAEKNFRRARVKAPVKRKSGLLWLSLRSLRLVVPVLLALYATYRGVHLVTTASAFQVQKVIVKGNSRLSAGEMEALITGLRGASIISVDLMDFRDRLKKSPWVADAALRRVLPSTIEIFISERMPIGLCRLGTDVYLLDRTGMIIDEYGPRYADFDLPLINGVVSRVPRGEPLIDERRTALAASVLDAIAPHPALASRVSQIDVTDERDAVVLLENETAFLHLGTSRFVERLTFYLEIAPTLRDRVAEMDYVDLRFDRRAYVRPVGGKTLLPASSFQLPAGTRR
jgi:cell division protein FtsQ